MNDDDTPSLTEWVSGTESDKKYAEYLVSSFSGGGGGGSDAGTSPLPVTLVSFKAAKNENQAAISWVTSSETNSDFFEIQKSPDALNWRIMGKVPAASESNSRLSYFFHDAEPFEHQNYYRLKITDKDGSFAYSRIETVFFPKTASAMIYPNPTTDMLYFKSSEVGQIVSVRIFNAAGQLILDTKEIAHGIPLRQFNPGTYILGIAKTDESIVYKKVVVVK